MFWGAIPFDGRERPIKCSNKMNTDENPKVLQKHQENLHFDALVYQQENDSVKRRK